MTSPKNPDEKAPESAPENSPETSEADEAARPFQRTHTIITSFSDVGFGLYGERFLKSCRENFGEDVRLVVFWETAHLHKLATDESEEMPAAGEAPQRYAEVLPDEVVNWVDWRWIDTVDGLPEFMANIEKFPLMTGQADNGYNINFDARMCRKSFMLRHAVKEIGGKVFWLDADSYVFDKVTTDWLDELLPDDVFTCYLGREHLAAKLGEAGPPTYTESGFLGMNANHDLAHLFVGVLVETLIQSGAIFIYPGWHDCWAYDATRQQIQPNNPSAFVNLSAGLQGGQTGHVFINSRVGEKIDHMKGNRKFAKRSDLKDLTQPRSEKYWGGPGYK